MKQQDTVQMQRSHEGFKCDSAGFVINSLDPHVGAASLMDIVVSYKDINPQEITLIKLSYHVLVTVCLKKTHKYYTSANMHYRHYIKSN